MIRELITNGVISIEFVRSQQNLADHLTKELARDLVIKYSNGLKGSILEHPDSRIFEHIILENGFGGQKYDLAARKKTIKLVEDCLRKWEIVPEKDYSKSGYELEMEMELEAPRSLSNTIASRGFSIGAGIPRSLYSCSMLMRFCQQLEMMPEALIRQDVSSSLSISNAEKVVSDEAAVKFQLAVPSCEGYISLDDDLLIRESSHVGGGQELRKNPQADSDAKSPARITPSKTILRNSSGLKGKDVPADISYLDTSAAASPAKDTAFKTTRMKSPGFNCKNVIGDVAVSKTPTPEILQDEDFDVVQRPQKNYRETSLDAKVDKSDTGVAITVMQGPVLTNSVVYVPPRNGILGAQSLLVCLTGYRGEDKMKIIIMVQLMGAKCTLLLDDTVTHLMCYKFEGKKYEAAKRKKTIKLVNHKWLEDCLRNWEIVPEKDYSKR
ncbi:BRCT domain-containing protein [Tanacetum coccineum]